MHVFACNNYYIVQLSSTVVEHNIAVNFVPRFIQEKVAVQLSSKSIHYRMLDVTSLSITGTECLGLALEISNGGLSSLTWMVHWLIMYAESMLCGVCVCVCVWVCA